MENEKLQEGIEQFYDNYNGASDLRTEEEKAKDFNQEEFVAGISPIDWIEKSPEKWRSFPELNQFYTLKCFPSSINILMDSLKSKKIKDVVVGDIVMTHNGNKKQVTKTFRRKWQGTMESIKVKGLIDKIECTQEHPIFAIKTIKKQAKPYNEEARFYEAKELTKDDWVSVPISREVRDTTINSIEKNPEFLWILGLYMAEGCINSTDRSSITFGLHQKETDYYERIKTFFNKTGVNVNCYTSPKHKGMSVNVYSKYWAELLSELGGEKCDKKKINHRLMFLEPILQMQIVKGIIDGDGSTLTKRTVLVSTSFEMIKQVQFLLMRNNVFSFLNKRKDEKGKKPVWTLEFSKGSHSSFLRGDTFFVKIQNKESIKGFTGGYVYNFEVEDDNSYIANGVGVHNCVSFTTAKLALISLWLKTKETLRFSPNSIYKYRSNSPSGGMIGDDAFGIWKDKGISLDIVCKSNQVQEGDPYEISNFAKAVAQGFKLGGYITITEKDFDRVASTIQTTGKGIMVWFYFTSREWSLEIPRVIDNLTNPYLSQASRHSVTAVDYGLKDGVEVLKIEDSAWFGGRNVRYITREFFKSRNFLIKYPMNFEYEDPQATPVTPPVTPPANFIFTETMKFGSRGEQVRQLQIRLKALGFFPSNINTTGYFGNITKASVIKFQLSRNLVGDGVVGKFTLKELNM